MPPLDRPGPRLLLSAAAVAAGFLLCYPFAPRIYAFLAGPLLHAYAGAGLADPRMIFVGLTDAFSTYFHVAVWAGSFVAFPFVTVQLGMIVAPAGLGRDGRASLAFLVAAPGLFFAGGAFLYFGVLPVAGPLLLGLRPPTGTPIRLEVRIGEYLGLVTRLILAFGLAFEMPVALAFLDRAGLLTGDGLRRGRPYALVAVLVAAAALAAPSVPGQGAVALTMLLLYEVSIVLVRRVEGAGARA